MTTVAGDIYTAGTPADARNFLLQTPDHAGADWVIETKLSGTIQRRLRARRLLASGHGVELRQARR